MATITVTPPGGQTPTTEGGHTGGLLGGIRQGFESIVSGSEEQRARQRADQAAAEAAAQAARDAAQAEQNRLNYQQNYKVPGRGGSFGYGYQGYNPGYSATMAGGMGGNGKFGSGPVPMRGGSAITAGGAPQTGNPQQDLADIKRILVGQQEI